MDSLVRYTPTRQEEAYALYLIEQAFGLTSVDESFFISGANAVGFLTSSGVQRLVLRNIWSVADPGNEGNLTSIAQFHVVLRLVSLAQAGLLWDNDMQGTLLRTSQQSLALPVFQGTKVPTDSELAPWYGRISQQLEDGQLSMSSRQLQVNMAMQPPTIPIVGGTDGEVVPDYIDELEDSFGDFEGADDAPSKKPPTPITYMQELAAPTLAATQTPSWNQQPQTGPSQIQPSKSFDAFDSLGPVEDAPLPALTSFQPQPEVSTDVSTAPPQSARSINSFLTAKETSSYDQDDFGGFTSAAAPTVTPTNNDATNAGFPTGAIQQTNDTADEFGGFEGASNSIAESTNNDAGSFYSASRGSDGGDDDVFHDSIMDMSDTINGTETMDKDLPGVSNHSDPPATNATEEPATPVTPIIANKATSAPPPEIPSGGELDLPAVSSGGMATAADDPFGHLGVQDAPLPALRFGITSNDGSIPLPGATLVQQGSDEGEDDFGGFTEAPIQTTTTPAVAVPHGLDVNIAMPQDIAQSLATAPQEDVLNAVDTTMPHDLLPKLPGEHYATAPNLSASEITEANGTTNIAIQEGEDEAEEEFGDFEDTSSIPKVDNYAHPPLEPDISMPPDNILPAPITNSEEQQPHDLEVDASMPKDSLPKLPGQHYVDAPDLSPIGEDNADRVPASQQTPEDDPFAAFGVQDAPLPSLAVSAPTTTTELAEPVESANDDDDFGDFAAAVVETKTEPATFDLLGGFEEPLSNPPDASTGAAAAAASGDLLGGFVEQQSLSSPPASLGSDLLGMTMPTEPQITPASDSQPDVPDDDFGDFAAASEPPQPSPSMNVTDDDDFGDFSVANEATTAGDKPVSEQEPASATTDFDAFEQGTVVQPAGEQDDSFGDFEEAGVAKAKEESATPNNDLFDAFKDTTGNEPQSTSNDHFADFVQGSEPATTTPPLGTTEENGEKVPGDEGKAAESEAKDDFGDFGSFEDVAPVAAEAPALASSNDDFGDFGGFQAPAPVVEAAPASQEDDFGDFASFDKASAPAIQQDEDFGSFEKVAASTEAPQTSEPPVSDDDVGNFGSFENVSSSTQAPRAPSDDDFGNFGSFEKVSSPTDAPAAPASEDGFDDFGDFASAAATSNDWDAFQDAPTKSPEKDKMANQVATRDKWLSLCVKLPEATRRQSKASKHVDFANCFDTRIGTKSVWNEEQTNRVERSMHVLNLLTSTQPINACTYWTQVLAVARDELSRGLSLLKEASSFSPTELSELRAPLATMVAGLAEYVRIVRSILGALGDLLLLDLSSHLTADTWSKEWCSIRLVETALEIERNWTDIESRSVKMQIEGVTKLESIEEIRTACGDRSPTDSFCQLTLQPLSPADKKNTKARVEWGGNVFMACAANFLANSCPFYVENR